MQLEASLRLAFPPPSPGLQISVVLPVRNEAVGLERALTALTTQKSLAGKPFDGARYEILLLANNCDDGSAALARHFAARHPAVAVHVAEIHLPAELAHIGHVRRLLMDEACERLGAAGSPGGWIASTDGDTVVAPDWLAASAQALAAGAAAVGGRIVLDPRCPVEPRTLRWQRLDAAFRLARAKLEHLLDPDPADPWPRHHQHFCASLAVTRRAYLQVGGVPPVRYLEDEALVDALRRQDLPVRHSPAVKVMTSPRQEGRAEVGLAWQLRQWSQDAVQAEGLMCEHTDDWLAQVLARRELRALWQSSRARAPDPANSNAVGSRLAETLEVPLAWLTGRIASAAFFGSLWSEVQAQRDRHPGRAAMRVPVSAALKQLRALIAAQPAGRSVRPSTSIR